MARNILFTHLPFRLFSNLFSVTMLALLLRISSKIAQKCRRKIAELILSTLLITVAASGKISLLQPFPKQTFPVFREISQAYGGDGVVGHLVGGHRHADIVVRESV